jgi:redox-sensitive bicupin YhaK (pirin superfamily)
MIEIRPAAARGHADHGWLNTWHSFSFADYYDPNNMGFRSLRVINEDFIAPAMGFGMHPHRDMEIITYVLEGAIRHKDNLGNGSVIVPGEVQRMSAGTGIVHSEFNGSESEQAHLLQIWIMPDKRAAEPGYDQRPFPKTEIDGRLRLVASRDGRDGALSINQDVDLYASSLEAGTRLEHRLAPGRYAWVQVARGGLNINGTTLAAGDGAAISDEERLAIEATESAEFLLFDLN